MAGGMPKSLGHALISLLTLGFMLLALGCAGGTYASQKSAHLGTYEGNLAGKWFGPPGG